MALNLNQQVRLLCQDNTLGLYIISDDEISFLLQRNNNSVDRTLSRSDLFREGIRP